MAPLTELRMAMGFTLARVASRMGISLQYLWQLENGARDMNAQLIQRLADALGVDRARVLAAAPPDRIDLDDLCDADRIRVFDFVEKLRAAKSEDTL